MPVTPWVGYKPKSWVVSSQWLGYTALWNLLNYAAVTVPVTKVDKVLDEPDEEWLGHRPRNDSDRFNWGQCTFTFISYLSRTTPSRTFFCFIFFFLLIFFLFINPRTGCMG